MFGVRLMQVRVLALVAVEAFGGALDIQADLVESLAGVEGTAEALQVAPGLHTRRYLLIPIYSAAHPLYLILSHKPCMYCL